MNLIMRIFAMLLGLVSISAYSANPCVGFLEAKQLLDENQSLALPVLTGMSDAGCSDASYTLGIVFSSFKYAKYDNKKAISYFAKSAQKNHALGQANLGLRFYRGEGVDRNKPMALALIRASALQGLDKSMAVLTIIEKNATREDLDSSHTIDLVQALSELVLDPVYPQRHLEPRKEQSLPSVKAEQLKASEIYERSIPHVFTLLAKGDTESDSLGTGFLVNGSFMITNEHVIGRNSYAFGFNKRYEDVELKTLYVSKVHDLAILKPVVDIKGGLKLARRNPSIGEEIVVIGSPSALAGSITEGIVSSYRPIKGLEYMQISAPINPGNSGGPVIDYKGNVVGLVTLKHKDAEAIGFALSIEELVKKLHETTSLINSRIRIE